MEYILIWKLAEYRIYCHRKPQFYATPTLPGGLRSDSFHPHPSHVAAYVDGVLGCQFVYLFKPTKRCAKDETRWGLYTRLTWGRKVSEKFLKINRILSTSVLVRGGREYCRAWHGSRLLAQPEWYKSLIRNKQNSGGGGGVSAEWDRRTIQKSSGGSRQRTTLMKGVNTDWWSRDGRYRQQTIYKLIVGVSSVAGDGLPSRVGNKSIEFIDLICDTRMDRVYPVSTAREVLLPLVIWFC